MALSNEEFDRLKGLIGERQQPNLSGFSGSQQGYSFKEAGQDFMQMGEGIIGAAKETFKKQQQAFSSDQPLASKLTQAIGIGAGGASKVFGEAVIGGGKMLLPQSSEESIKSGVQSAVAPIVQSQPVQNLISKYESLDENTKRDVDSLLGIGSFVADIAGLGIAGKGAKAIGEVAEQGGKQVFKTSVEVASKLKQIGSAKTVKIADSIIPIPETVKTTLKRTTPEQFSKYIDEAKNAVIDQKALTPLESAGQKATESLQTIQNKLNSIGSQKASILEKAKTGLQPMGNIALKARQSLNQQLGKLTLDAPDTSLMKDISGKLKSLGSNPSVKKVDEFIDYAQEQLFKGTDGLTVSIGSRTEAVLKNVIKQMNDNVKKVAGKSYSNLNKQYSDIIDIRNKLNKALGTDANKGGSLMKRVFSPTDGGTKKLFEEVKKLTGVDLTDEAVLAKFAMELYGDVRQKSLLEGLGLPTTSGLVDKLLQVSGDITGLDDFITNLKLKRATKIQAGK